LSIVDSPPSIKSEIMLTEKTKRREFCRVSLSAAAALCIAPATELRAAEDDMLPIIDTHQHLWNLDKFRLPWISADSPLHRNYTVDDYWRAASGTGIAKTIYMEVAVALDQQEAELTHIAALVKERKNRIAAATVGGRPQSPGFDEYVQKLKHSGVVKGIRAPIAVRDVGQKIEPDPDFVAGVRLLGRERFRFDINVSPNQLPLAAALVDQAPDTNYVLDHCGNIAPGAQRADFERWKSAIAEVARRKPIVCKVSGFIANAKDHKPRLEDVAAVINHVCECFGPDRVMFGGDWPVCTLAMPLTQWVATLRRVIADRPIDEQKKLLHDNASDFYQV
jgi:predicted TIM-barrel fold metal-dependent hydrolase